MVEEKPDRGSKLLDDDEISEDSLPLMDQGPHGGVEVDVWRVDDDLDDGGTAFVVFR